MMIEDTQSFLGQGRHADRNFVHVERLSDFNSGSDGKGIAKCERCNRRQ